MRGSNLSSKFRDLIQLNQVILSTTTITVSFLDLIGSNLSLYNLELLNGISQHHLSTKCIETAYIICFDHFSFRCSKFA